jgi:predicted GNAT family acetyltransferase
VLLFIARHRRADDLGRKRQPDRVLSGDDPMIDGERTVRDNREAGRYELQVGDRVAFLDYRRTNGTVVLAYVETPVALRGRGLAGILTRHALEAARAEGLRVVPQCSFVRDYIRKHPEFEELVATPPREPGDGPRT